MKPRNRIKKTGSRSTLKEFRRTVRHLARHDYLPNYSVEFDADRDQLIFKNRGTVSPTLPADASVDVAALRPNTYEKAKALAPGWDVYFHRGEMARMTEGTAAQRRRGLPEILQEVV